MALTGYHIFLLILTVDNSLAAGLTHCADIARSYTSMGYNSLDVPTSPVRNAEDALEICGGGVSCCTRDMEMNIAAYARQQYDVRFNKTTETARNTLILITKDFHELFVKILRDSESDLDMKFTQSFGAMYTKNKQMYTELYQSLVEYLNGSDVHLNTVLDKFSSTLFTKLFAIRNGLTESSHSDYLKCVSSKYKSLKPFDETMDKLKRSLRHSMVAARTLLQGLAVGRNTMIQTAQIEPTASCSKANTKMSYCSHCVGLSSITPCRDYCLNVMKGCLASHYELQSFWSSYAESLYSLSARFEDEDAFNLNKIASYLADDISHAIRKFQENLEVDAKVKGSDMCGKVTGSVEKRSVDIGGGLTVRTKRQLSNVKNKEQLKTLVQILQENLRLTKSIWLDLPYLLCANVTNQAYGSGTTCWNGTSQARYKHAEIRDGLIGNIGNPEVTVSVSQLDERISACIQKLQRVKAEMDKAKEGLSSDWIQLQIPLSSEYLNSLRLKYPSVKSINDDGGVFSQRVPTQPLKLLGSNDDEIGSGSGSGVVDDLGWNRYNRNEDDEDNYPRFPGPHIIPIDPTQQHGPFRTRLDFPYSGSGDGDEEITETKTSPQPADERNKNTVVMKLETSTLKMETLIPLATRTAVPAFKDITYSEQETTSKKSETTTALKKTTKKMTPKPANRAKESQKTDPPVKSGRSQSDDSSAETKYPCSFLFLMTVMLILI